MTIVDAPTERGVAAVQQDVLAVLVEPGVDLATARAEFTIGRGRRRLTRRVVAGSLAILLLAVVSTVVLRSGEDDPDAVLADRDEQVTSSTTSTPAPVATDPVAAVPDTVPVTTVVALTTTVPQPLVAAPTDTTPTTVLANQPLQATLAVLTPTVEAGATASIAVSWADPDLGNGAGSPRHTVAWGDPLVSTPVDATARVACDTPGAPGAGADTLRFRYSTPGAYVVRVVVETCGGQGAFGERVAVEGTVTVTPPMFVDATDPSIVAAGQSLVVFQPPLVAGGVWPALEGATVDYVPTTDPTPVPLRRGEAIPVFTTSGPATILILPADATGTVHLRWKDPAVCSSTAGTELSAADGGVLALPLVIVPC